MNSFRVSGFPENATAGQIYNLFFLYPGFSGWTFEHTSAGPVTAEVHIAGDAVNAATFVKVYNGRVFDGSVDDPVWLSVDVLGDVTASSEPEPSPARCTLYGSGFTSSEKRRYVEDEIERLAPGGLVDVRVVSRRNGAGMVFVDFDTFESARAAKRAWRDGIKLKTGRCTFEMSRTC